MDRAEETGKIRGLLPARGGPAGGRSILNAVSHALDLDSQALTISRNVLHNYGNMSSATLMFALAGFLDRPSQQGVALAFGPGLAAEGFRFHEVD